MYRLIHENGGRDKGGYKNGRDEAYTNIRYESMIVNFVDGDAIVETGCGGGINETVFRSP
jgi:hypothetical protein